MDSFDWLFEDSPVIVSQTEESSDEPVWTTAQGDKIPLSKMTNSHIGHCINMLKGRKDHHSTTWLMIFREEFLRRLHTPLNQGFTL